MRRLLHTSLFSYILLLLLAAGLSGCPPKTGKAVQEARPQQVSMATTDNIYDANIKTVQIFREENPLAMPVTYMGSFDPLTLEFDELRSIDSRESDFFVDIVACNEYWEPAIILPIEFYEGFTQDRIQEYQRSEFTKVEYVHYRYQFPQENESFKLSGNYMIKVYRDGDPSAVVFTRRFIVVESLVGIGLANELSQSPRRRRMEDMSFLVNPGNLDVFNPMNDLHVNLVPNFRFDQTAELSAQQLFDGQLRFEVDLLRTFPDGHEFRSLDLRSTRFLSASIEDVEEREEIYDVYLYGDTPWMRNTFGRQPDLNGNYFIEVQEWPRAEVQADYVYTYFSFPMSTPLSGKQVYVLGKFTDWKLSTSNRMRWNEEFKQYEAEILLKQGYYDYQYATAPTFGDNGETSTLQGQLTDAENNYYVIVYYRSPMDRNDRVVGFWAVNG